MYNKVLTYSDPLNWKSFNEYENMKDAIHICATSNMKKGIQERYGNDNNGLKHIVSIREILLDTFKDWYSPNTNLKQYFALSKVLKNMSYKNAEIKKALLKDKESVLESIRNLVQSGATANQLKSIPNLTDLEIAFIDVWEVIEGESLFSNHMKQLNIGFLNDLKYEKNGELIKLAVSSNTKIYLHGFYYITPEQQTFFDLLKNKQCELIIFQYYEPSYPATFNFMKKFFNENYGWTNKWISQKSIIEENRVADIFLSVYENRIVTMTSKDLKVERYNTFFDLLQQVIMPMKDDATSDGEKVKLFTANTDVIENSLEIHVPELLQKQRSFLQFPLGKFLINIHKVFENGDYYLTEDLLVELFSSGWLVDETTNVEAKNCTYDLMQIMPYLQGCKRLDEWLSRINQLVTQKEEIEQTFKTASTSRIDRMMRSPFEKLSYFAVDVENIIQIKIFIEEIKILVEDLFEHEKDSSTIEAHFTKLQRIMEKQNHSKYEAPQYEKELIEKLLRRTGELQDTMEFLYEDVESALRMYLNGEFETDEESQNLINPFLNIDGEMFMIDDEKKYLFTCLDENSVPFINPSLIWPLTQKTLEGLSKERNRLSLHVALLGCKKEVSRFLFFIMLKFIPTNKLKLSWVANIGGREDINPAMYLRQLNLPVEQTKVITSSFFEETTQIIEEQQQECKRDLIAERMIISQLDTLGIKAEYESCPKKFYYGYILNEYPKVQENLTHEFIFVEILRFAIGLQSDSDLNTNVKNALEEITAYFPQWLNSKKSAMAMEFRKSAYRFKSDEYVNRATKRLFFPGLKNDLQDQFFKEALEEKSFKVDDFELTIESKPNKLVCMHCSYKDICNDAIYGID